ADAKVIAVVLEARSREQQYPFAFDELGAKAIDRPALVGPKARKRHAAGTWPDPREAVAESVKEFVEERKMGGNDFSTARDDAVARAERDKGEDFARGAAADR